jgi:hypothetical protein
MRGLIGGVFLVAFAAGEACATEATQLTNQVCNSLIPVTPSDTTTIKAGALYIGTAGNLVVDDNDGHTAVTISNVAVGIWPFRVTKVRAATTASNIVACN